MSWQAVTEGERAWWGDCTNTAEEEAKQLKYATLMGLDKYKPNWRGWNVLPFDLAGRSVLDIGGGPASLLLKCINRGRRVVADPIGWPQWALDRYTAAGIEYVQAKAETLDLGQRFDEVWMYNVLPHVEDPEAVCRAALKHGRVVRVFDWLDMAPDTLHPHTLRQEKLDQWLDTKGTRHHLEWPCYPADAYTAVIGKEMQRFRFHLLGLAHLPTRREISCCFSDDTDIMTLDGWVSLADYVRCKSDIPVATLNAEKDIVEFQKPQAYHDYEYAGPMIRQGGLSIDLLVTPNHKMFVSTHRAGVPITEYTTSRFELKTADSLPKNVHYKRDFPWDESDCVDIGTFVLPAYSNGRFKERPAVSFPMDDWLRFLGIFLSEGSLSTGGWTKNDGTIIRKPYSVSIAQQKTLSRNTMYSWIEALGFDHICENKMGFTVCDVQLATYLKQFGYAAEKYIPKEIKNLPRRRLKILLEALLLGDGEKETETLYRYYSMSKQLADDVSEIGLKLGYVVTSYLCKTGKYVVSLSDNPQKGRTPWCRPGMRSEESYSGRVYCLTVPNHLLYVRHNGKSCWAGNCAYTQKIVKLARMLKGLGHWVAFYGNEGSAVECDEFVPVLSAKERIAAYGDYDQTQGFFREGSGDDAAHTAFNVNAVCQIGARAQPRDFLLCTMGLHHKPIADALKDRQVLAVEPGIGYTGVFAEFKAFESYAWMHYLYGLRGTRDGAWYDAVIPSYLDMDDFPFQPVKSDYYLYIGRLIWRKGLEVAAQATERLGAKLVVAGQGDLDNPNEGLNLSRYSHIEHVGSVGSEERARLMGSARAVFVPTLYIGPFETVAVEAMACGTPVLATDWGVFAETVLHGVTGYRCRTLEQFVWAAQNAHTLSPVACRDWAISNYSMDRVALMFQEWFEQLYGLWGAGWPQPNPGREELDWLRRYYPKGVDHA